MESQSSTLGLRIAAVFVLFIVSALGCLTPYLFIQGRKRQEKQGAGGAAAEGRQLQHGSNGHGHGDEVDREKPHKNHRHLEAFNTTRSMHLLKAFSAGGLHHLVT